MEYKQIDFSIEIKRLVNFYRRKKFYFGIYLSYKKVRLPKINLVRPMLFKKLIHEQVKNVPCLEKKKLDSFLKITSPENVNRKIIDRPKSRLILKANVKVGWVGIESVLMPQKPISLAKKIINQDLIMRIPSYNKHSAFENLRINFDPLNQNQNTKSKNQMHTIVFYEINLFYMEHLPDVLYDLVNKNQVDEFYDPNIDTILSANHGFFIRNTDDRNQKNTKHSIFLYKILDNSSKNMFLDAILELEKKIQIDGKHKIKSDRGFSTQDC